MDEVAPSWAPPDASPLVPQMDQLLGNTNDFSDLIVDDWLAPSVNASDMTGMLRPGPAWDPGRGWKYGHTGTRLSGP